MFDPVLPPALSRALSVILLRFVKRHGSLLVHGSRRTLLAFGAVIHRPAPTLALPITQGPPAGDRGRRRPGTPCRWTAGLVVETIRCRMSSWSSPLHWLGVAIQVSGAGSSRRTRERGARLGRSSWAVRSHASRLPRSRGVEEQRVGTVHHQSTGFGRAVWQLHPAIDGDRDTYLDAYFDVPGLGRLRARPAALAACPARAVPGSCCWPGDLRGWSSRRDRLSSHTRLAARRDVRPRSPISLPRRPPAKPSSSVVTARDEAVESGVEAGLNDEFAA